MQLKNNPLASPQQIADLAAFRNSQKDRYLRQMPTAGKFFDLKQILTDRLEQHWPKADVKETIDVLVEASWSYTAPGYFLLDAAEQVFEAIKGGATIIDLREDDLELPLTYQDNGIVFKSEREELAYSVKSQVRLSRFGQLTATDPSNN